MISRPRNARRLLLPAACLLVLAGCGEDGGGDGVTPTVISPLADGAGTPDPGTVSPFDDVPVNGPDTSDTPVRHDRHVRHVRHVPMRPADTTDTTDTTDDAPEAFDLAALEGDWLRACGVTDTDDPDSTFSVTMLNVVDAVATERELRYEDEACQVPASPTLLSPADLSGTYSVTLSGGTTETSLGTAAHLDATFLNVEIDGVSFDAEQLRELGLNGSFNIALIDGSELYFGDLDPDDLDGLTPATRPDTLDLRPYVRQ